MYKILGCPLVKLTDEDFNIETFYKTVVFFYNLFSFFKDGGLVHITTNVLHGF